jgi:hypothetical protein
MDDAPHKSKDVAGELLSGRYRWWLRGAAAVVLALVFLAYQQYDLLIGWVNAIFC